MVNYSLYSVMHKTVSVCLFLFVCCTSSLSILLIIDNKEQIHLINMVPVYPTEAVHDTYSILTILHTRFLTFRQYWF